jgi:cell division protein FtsL
LGDKADPVKIAKLRGEIGQLDTEISNLEKSIEGASTELADLQKGF